MINLDGTGITRLTLNESTEKAPSWKASGFQLVFQSHRDGNEEIYRMGSDGPFHTNLTNTLKMDRAPDLEH